MSKNLKEKEDRGGTRLLIVRILKPCIRLSLIKNYENPSPPFLCIDPSIIKIPLMFSPSQNIIDSCYYADLYLTYMDYHMTQYRKKPVVVDAMQFHGGWSGDGALICDWVGKGAVWSSMTDGLGDLQINTLEGVMTASPGDYIIKGVNGEFYPCKPDIFAKTYEKVE